MCSSELENTFIQYTPPRGIKFVAEYPYMLILRYAFWNRNQGTLSSFLS